MTTNPFKVYSPEDMPAAEVLRLYVPVAEKLEIDGPEHVFIHGHRGCGKSMMFRYMMPDCQMLVENKNLRELPYLGLYATVKTAGLDVTEYERLKNQYAGLVLAEHSLVSFLGSKAFRSLDQYCFSTITSPIAIKELQEFVVDRIFQRLRSAGAATNNDLERAKSASKPAELLAAVSDSLDKAYGVCSDYLRRSSFTADYHPYQGPLLGYREFLFPILSELNQLSFMPQRRPIYFFIDDADNLNLQQTQVLNTWVSFRTADRVSFKISTQLSYKTYLTTSKQRIEATHDYREIYASSIHTGPSSSAKYPQWVAKVIQKRLEDHGVGVDIEKFFPPDAKQEARIAVIADDLRKRWEKEPKGYRANDDAYRYARPDYIKSLGGTSKQQSNYLYAGFDQLVHISSGIIRFFLDNAAQMYAEQELHERNSALQDGPVQVTAIEPSIQDEAVRLAADNLMFGAFDKLEQEALASNLSVEADEFRKLRNLIRGFGGIFQEILFSDRSERRVFSIALSDDPPDEIMRVLRLGVRNGYFYEAAIGSKAGKWRTRRYVMTRRLAPLFKLDPMGFSGYLFVTTELLQLAISNPQKAISSFRENRLGSVLADKQLELEI